MRAKCANAAGFSAAQSNSKTQWAQRGIFLFSFILAHFFQFCRCCLCAVCCLVIIAVDLGIAPALSFSMHGTCARMVVCVCACLCG